MNRRTRIRYAGLSAIATTALATGTAVALSAPSNASPTQAESVQTLTSATNGACSPTPSLGNWLTASKWRSGAYDRYHLNMTVYNRAWTAFALTVGGTPLADKTDSYINKTPGTYRIEGTWRYSVADGYVTYKCSFNL